MPYIPARVKRSREHFVKTILDNNTPIDLDVPLRNGAPITSPFGMRQHPILNKPMLHSGIDYGAEEGTPIYAAEDGMVDENVPDPVGGFKVTVRHRNGTTTRYLHMKKLSPLGMRGGPVKRGDVLGWVGSTGRSTGPHLHFGMRKDGKAIDPSPYFYNGYKGV